MGSLGLFCAVDDIMFASEAWVDSHFYEFLYANLFFSPLCLVELLLGVQSFQILELSKQQCHWLLSWSNPDSPFVATLFIFIYFCYKTTGHGKINLNGVFFVLPLWFISNYGLGTMEVQMWTQTQNPIQDIFSSLFFLIISVNSLPENSPECKQSFVLLGLLLLLLSLDAFGKSTTKCSVEQNSFCSDCSYRRVSGDSCSGGDVESRLDGEMLPCPVGGKPLLCTHLVVCHASFC